MSSQLHLRILGYVATLVMHGVNVMYMASFHRGEVLEDPEIRNYIGLKTRFLTSWTFLFQMIYAALGLTCDVLALMNFHSKKYKLPNVLSETRNTLFSAIIWPSSMQVATLFWPFYLYDKSLVIPHFIDRILTPLSNHIVHTAIVPVVVWEMVLLPRSSPRSHVKYVSIMSGYTLTYFAVLIYTFIERGSWIYPIFGHVAGTVYFPVTMSKLGYLRILGYVATLVMHIGNLIYIGINLKPDILEDKRIRVFADTRRRYFTSWTVFLQMIYAILGIWCEVLLIRNSAKKNYKVPKYLKGCRDTMFAAILWPATFLVFTIFWTLFLYDRSLIFPDFIDKVLTPTSNHIMHTAIVPVVLWEILLQPRYEPRSHMNNLAHLTIYMLVYLAVLIYTYMEKGIWLYPIFKKIYGTIYFPVLILIITVLLLIFYRMQWTISYLIYGKEKQKKEKQKKIR